MPKKYLKIRNAKVEEFANENVAGILKEARIFTLEDLLKTPWHIRRSLIGKQKSNNLEQYVYDLLAEQFLPNEEATDEPS